MHIYTHIYMCFLSTSISLYICIQTHFYVLYIIVDKYKIIVFLGALSNNLIAICSSPILFLLCWPPSLLSSWSTSPFFHFTFYFTSTLLYSSPASLPWFLLTFLVLAVTLWYVLTVEGSELQTTDEWGYEAFLFLGLGCLAEYSII